MRREPRSAAVTAATRAQGAPVPSDGAAAGDGRVAGYRLLRRVATGDRSEVHLAVDAVDGAGSPAGADGATARRPVAVKVYRDGVDDDQIGTEIAVMGADASGTLPTLVDVAVLDDRRRVLVLDRIAGPTLAHLLGERLLDPGEATTILAPLVAAAAGLADAGFVHTRMATSDVMIDETGRPRLVGLGAVRSLDAAGAAVARTELLRESHRRLAALIEEVARSTRQPAVFERAAAIARSGAESRPFARTEGEIERALFAAATAAPVRTNVGAAARGSLPTRIAPSTSEPMMSTAGPVTSQATRERQRPAGSRARGWRATLGELAQLPIPAVEPVARSADADRAGAARRRWRELIAGRRRPLVVGAAAGGAALVLLLTLVPPSAEAGGVDRETVTATDSASSGRTEARRAAVPTGGTGGADEAHGTERDSDGPAAEEGAALVDPVAAAVALMTLRQECLAAIDAGCLDQVDQPGSALDRSDREALARAREGEVPEVPGFALDQLSVSAEMGDAVLLELPYADPQREPASLLVMRGEAGWRLRELFD
ncbi:hypothetical protein [Agromyces sp. S2-1-8]|uniref:hypothetical protein n=1 Tax=Agromyces sp. S2-1-8 TaxID=2897180 RepID=UPI001E361061|nr:hypothetical protein [Agromyces sp. S2-1-8]MCD5347234.1 hypothetical protein [Agromyces sp. S2-1-8]